MKTISLVIDDSTFEQTEMILLRTKIPLEEYLNKAIDSYNKIQNRKYLESCLRSDSYVVRKESMRILRDFENL